MWSAALARISRNRFRPLVFSSIYTRGPVVIDAHVRQTMKKILADVQSGAFAREWMDENTKGRKRFLEMRAKAADHVIEKVGVELRKMMAWNRPSEQEVTAAQAQARR